ncbi:ABC transporter permease subunit [Halostagnicola sp. A-GB9-2]|uniref:ABC transporter permease n=1 Tax=Halostagnicola sp. A-GB9-2 TaxID=3048066 RepID=UPI0024C0AB08|nr:ABC transporter permease subunit [Halostagnicola sp. A-GB9-2]MDJ1433153.1 ABC transporter permease subunit [Halostagnicola sp. A-GB9-2]
MSITTTATRYREIATEFASVLASPSTEREREQRRIAVMCLPFFVLGTFAAFVPLVVMARMSVSADPFENAGYSLEAWRTLATDSTYLTVAWNTLWFAALTTIVSVALGVAISHALEKYSLPFENVLVAVLSFPIALPGIVVAFLIVTLLGRQGLVTNLAAVFTGQSAIDLATATTVTGLFIGYVYSLVPRSTMVLRGTYAEINTDAEEAARALGAGSIETFCHVTLPQIRPGVVAAIILTFRSALAIFGTVLVLGGLTVATVRINYEISVGFDSQLAGAIGVVYFLFILTFTFASLRFVETSVVEL